MNLRSVLLALGLLFAAANVRGQVVVNEVCASNLSTLADNYGEFEDWFELYNPTGTDVDISGWWLSNRAGNPLKWQVPAGISVPANGYRVVFASKRNEVVGANIHAGFNLNQTEEDHVLLSDAAGTLIDDFAFTPITRTKVGHSRGRTTDGAATWSLFTTPTPGAANVGAAVEYLVRPALSPASGAYAGAQNVTINGPAGATIRYTTDGSLPTVASTAYAGPIPVATTTVIRATAFGAAGSQPSFTETNTYLIGTNHMVPILSICGDQVDELLGGNGGIEPIGHFEYFGPDGVLRDEAEGEFNEHGQDSWAYDQRGFDYIARDQTGYNDALHYPIFRTKDRPKYQRLIIKAAAGDNYNFGPGGAAHIRDAYVQALSQTGHLALDERSYEPAVLYMNGQYWGVYDMREKVDDHDFTRYYYDQDEFNIQMIKTWGGTWSEYGGAQAQADWNALRTYITTNNMGDPTAFAYVDERFSWKSLVDYFCLNSYTVCADWLNWNTGWWRGLDPAGDKKKWRYILWDMDATFGHYTNFTGIPDQTANADPCNAESLPNPGGEGHTVILEKLIAENAMVHDYYVNRYTDLGNTLFSCDHMIPFLDSLIALIEPEMPGQIARWGGSMAGWQANVQNMRDFIETRCVTIQEGMVDCYDLSGPHDVVFNVDPPLSGRIEINSITPELYPFHGNYYGGINTALAPLPEPGWIFSHWEVFSTNTILPSTTDSLVTIDILSADSIVAHFVPPTRYDIYLDVMPRNAGSITFDGITYTELPAVVSVPEGLDIPFHVTPALYHDFLFWSVKNNTYTPNDSTQLDLRAAFFSTDTIIAHLRPQEYTFYAPNAFTPNGDGINDVFHPMGQVIDLETFEFQVFDRWGGLIFETDDPNKGWDGTAGGTLLPDGVYVYRAYAIDAIERDVHESFGHITLFR
ncbi:MAG: CotH kinase family protein [Flavobacteriales bacterium]